MLTIQLFETDEPRRPNWIPHELKPGENWELVILVISPLGYRFETEEICKALEVDRYMICELPDAIYGAVYEYLGPWE